MASVELPLGVQGDAEVVVGRGVVGLEPDRLAEFGDRLVELALLVQGDAEADVGQAVVGLEPDRLAARGDGRVEHLGGLVETSPLSCKRRAQAAQVPAVLGRSRLRSRNTAIASSDSPRLQGMGQLVGRLGADRAGGGVEADRLVAAGELLQHRPQS